MQVLFRLICGIVGTGLVAGGLGFLLVPELLLPFFDIQAGTAQGLSFIRGDVAASPLLAGALILRAAWYGKGKMLGLPLIWFGVLVLGKTLSLLIDPEGVLALRTLIPDILALLVFLPLRVMMKPSAS